MCSKTSYLLSYLPPCSSPVGNKLNKQKSASMYIFYFPTYQHKAHWNNHRLLTGFSTNVSDLVSPKQRRKRIYEGKRCRITTREYTHATPCHQLAVAFCEILRPNRGRHSNSQQMVDVRKHTSTQHTTCCFFIAWTLLSWVTGWPLKFETELGNNELWTQQNGITQVLQLS